MRIVQGWGIMKRNLKKALCIRKTIKFLTFIYYLKLQNKMCFVKLNHWF